MSDLLLNNAFSLLESSKPKTFRHILMKLKMYLENIFIDQIEINFINKETVEERQKYLERGAKMLYDRHYNNIQLVNKEPIFFIDVPSRMNNE